MGSKSLGIALSLERAERDFCVVGVLWVRREREDNVFLVSILASGALKLRERAEEERRAFAVMTESFFKKGVMVDCRCNPISRTRAK